MRVRSGIYFSTLLWGLLSALLVAVFWNLSTGYMKLDFADFLSSASQNHQIAQLRVNRVLAVLLAGISIPTSGFILQEYFRNPLAGPEVLGISSVASLGVALYIFLSQDFVLPEFLQNSFLNIAAIAGSMAMMVVLLAFSHKIRDKSFLIIFGFLVSALAGAVISVLQYYADNQSLKNYILWSFGANNQLTGNQLLVLTSTVTAGLAMAFLTIRPLIGSALGIQYARSLGVRLSRLKLLVILSSSFLSASVTAFLGPVLFIGIVVPHFCRMIYNPSRLWQQWILNMFLGAVILEVFSVLSEILSLPMNVISSLFGIPVIISMLLKNKL